jgi:cysteine desulfurase
MLANNEIGVLQPISQIAAVCHERGALVHCDATQAVGKLPLDVRALGVDLMSFTAHKIYGPKGVGALFVRRGSPQVRLDPQIAGGGHERGLRSGTLNVPGIVGFAKACELCLDEISREQPRQQILRDRLFAGLTEALEGVTLNGPALAGGLRLAGNLNLSFDYVDGEALLMNMKEVAVSSGSACTSANPEPSHVLRALGLTDDAVKSSLRFGLGRFTTADEIERAIELVGQVVRRLRKLSSMA